MNREEAAAHWARWVRGLAILAGLLLVVAVAEGYTIRAARAEIATLRAEREQVRAGEASKWTSMASDDFVAAGKWLDRHIAHPDYLQHEGGLCGTGQPDFDAMAEYMLGYYVKERAAGRSHDAGIEAMRLAMLESDEWKVKHGKAIGGAAAGEPPAEVVDTTACPFEGCQLGAWQARERIALYDAAGGEANGRFIERGTRVTAMSREMRATPRRATVTRAHESDIARGITNGAVVYVLYPIGEGAIAVWHNGAVKKGSLDLTLDFGGAESKLQWTWWVRVQLPDGSTAWVKDPQGHFDGMDSLG